MQITISATGAAIIEVREMLRSTDFAVEKKGNQRGLWLVERISEFSGSTTNRSFSMTFVGFLKPVAHETDEWNAIDNTETEIERHEYQF